MRTLKLLVVGGLLSWTATAAAQSEDLYFTLANDSDVAVIGFYVSHTRTDSWEENLMEGAYLPGGNEIEVVIADGRRTCLYDLRTEFEDGDTFEDFEVDLCALGAYTLSD